MTRGQSVSIALALGAIVLALTAANLWFGELNQDEGWYLYAARQVRAGQLPFRDFAFTQGPIMPLTYALADPIVERWGVAGGRLFTALLGWVAVGLGAAVAARMVPRGLSRSAVLVACALLALNVYQNYFTTVVKTYSLCLVFLLAAVLALTCVRNRYGAWAALAAGVLFAAATGTRLSAGLAAPVAWLGLVRARRELPRGCWLAFGLGGLAGLASIFGPFLAAHAEGVRFGLLDYHAARQAGGLIAWCVYRVGFASRFAQAYLPALLITVALALASWFRLLPDRVDAGVAAPGRMGAWLWGMGFLISLAHASAGFPYEDYQVVAYPLFAIALAAALVRRAAAIGPAPERWTVLMVFLACTLGSAASPINQGWVVRGQDRIWWRLKEQTPLQTLRETGAWVREHSQPDDVLLTQDTYLAVEARRQVPAGLEMGPFSYCPGFSTSQAECLHLLNRELLEAVLADSPAPLAAFSGYGLSIRSPEIEELPAEEQARLWELVRRRYQQVKTVEPFGQANTPLRLLRRMDIEVDTEP